MNGAARSGKQNIVEGSDALRTSLKSGIKLTGVAKASFEELTGDLEDFLRQRNLAQWSKTNSRVLLLRKESSQVIRNLSNLRNLEESEKTKAQSRLLQSFSITQDPEHSTNLLLTLCHQETYLLHKQIEGLERKHATEGGYTEKLYNARIKYLK